MEPAHSIGRLGFRKWYERQLIEAHAWLVTTLLVAIVVAVTLEGISFRRPAWEFVPLLGLLFVGGLLLWYGVRRFGGLMAEANRLAEHSTCESCGTYGRFQVIEAYPSRMKVSCRKCSHRWMLG
ncbi:MAG: hypothetical protein ACT4P4_14225 [Betaproteobacteria bacterium]